ncbi:MAG TPA: LysM peptidoglycan-binding domain-containing protein [Candidatus Deferrimicrobiaceae bacterium]|nr:LysM peptidoglycan-binding domain-containing protein [Candidatus Deferrimicrobiaceae bacterium]
MKRRGIGCSVLAVLCAILFLPAAVSAQESTPAANPVEPREGLVHTVVKGDTLWDLSGKYLGSPWLWPELWERNRFLTNPHYIYPGIQVVVFPPSPREYVWEIREPAPPADRGGATPPSGEVVTAPVETKPTLSIPPEEFVRAGAFTPERPSGIGAIREGEQPKIAFSEGDKVYLALNKEIPEDQILGVYRVRGPVRSRTARSVSGYVSYLVGVLQVTGKHDGRTKAIVRKSFEDLSREDLIREEIPSYAPVFLREGSGGVEAFVITGRSLKVELATGDFVYLDRGSESGVAPGDVFRVYDGRDRATWNGGSRDVRIQVGKAVVVRVLPGSATAYVTSATQSFPAGAVARGGDAGSR